MFCVTTINICIKVWYVVVSSNIDKTHTIDGISRCYTFKTAPAN
jgi:hypothetical protein